MYRCLPDLRHLSLHGSPRLWATGEQGADFLSHHFSPPFSFLLLRLVSSAKHRDFTIEDFSCIKLSSLTGSHIKWLVNLEKSVIPTSAFEALGLCVWPESKASPVELQWILGTGRLPHFLDMTIILLPTNPHPRWQSSPLTKGNSVSSLSSADYQSLRGSSDAPTRKPACNE